VAHETALLATIAAGLGLALVLGYLATRLRLPPLVGYLAAGIVVGPFTPGYVADTGLASQLAEVGVILLMFGVGLHFSVDDLLAVRRLALPGALVRITVITALGAAIGEGWGWPMGQSIIFGMSLSVASTVVVLRTFEERDILTSTEGRLAVGWLIVEDVAMVLALVLLPALSGILGGTPASAGVSVTYSLLITLLKVAAFVAFMLFVGTRVVPWMLAAVARTGSRELFTLAVLAAALGIAFGAAQLFGVSFALGAFFAGVVIAESDLSYQAASDALPLQDAFAVLFFVSVGMVVDPRIVIQQPLGVAAALAIAILAKALVTVVVLLIGRCPVPTALTVAVGLAQVGEFSFILAGLGRSLGVLSREAQSLILAAAILSIAINSLLLDASAPFARWLRGRRRLMSLLERSNLETADQRSAGMVAALRGHVVIVGFGRVGSTIGEALGRESVPYVVVERSRELVESLRARGMQVLFGDASRPGILEHAHLEHASVLVIAAPGAFQTREILGRARRLNPNVDTVVRTHSEAEQRYLEQAGVGLAVMGERELAIGMARYALSGSLPNQAPRSFDAVRPSPFPASPAQE
jgi:CPA2 family monovalent cation:H+ antiporter-2